MPALWDQNKLTSHQKAYQSLFNSMVEAGSNLAKQWIESDQLNDEERDNIDNSLDFSDHDLYIEFKGSEFYKFYDSLMKPVSLTGPKPGKAFKLFLNCFEEKEGTFLFDERELVSRFNTLLDESCVKGLFFNYDSPKLKKESDKHNDEKNKSGNENGKPKAENDKPKDENSKSGNENNKQNDESKILKEEHNNKQQEEKNSGKNAEESLSEAIKAMRLYGEALKGKGFKKGQVAIDLAEQLQLQIPILCNPNKKSDEKDQKAFLTLLKSKNIEMSAYRTSWSTIILNVALACIPFVGPALIAAKLIHSKLNKNKALFFAQKEKTTGEEKVEAIENVVKNIFPKQ